MVKIKTKIKFDIHYSFDIKKDSVKYLGAIMYLIVNKEKINIINIKTEFYRMVDTTGFYESNDEVRTLEDFGFMSNNIDEWECIENLAKIEFKKLFGVEYEYVE